MKTRTFIVMVALLACASSAHAQDRTLERIQNMITTGRLTEARNTLMEWERENASPESTATSDDRARALYLAGALSTDAKAAEDAFIGVVLSYPSSPVAAEALLRLGQSLYTAGDNDRAIMYLERLRSDYPYAPERQTGLLWLARAQLASGDAALACGTARHSLFGTTNENVRMLMELERDRACAASGGIATSPPPETRPRRRADRDDTAFDRSPDVRRPAAPADTAKPADVRPAAASTDARTPAASADARASADTAVVISTARRAGPLPDLGIAVDANVREPARANDPSRSGGDTRTGSADRTANADRTAQDARNASDVRARRGAAAPTSSTEAPPRATDAPGASAAAATGPEYAVQAAAFSELRPAQTIAAEMRAKGFDSRIVQVPGSPYYRVRVGAFPTSDDAAAAALRIRDAGFATLIVKDVRLERQL